MREQFPVEPLQFLPCTPRISFEEGMRLLQEAGFEVRSAPPQQHTGIGTYAPSPPLLSLLLALYTVVKTLSKRSGRRFPMPSLP